MKRNRDIEFLFEVGNFRFMQRTWKRFSNPDVANNAEHAFRVAWIALALAKRENVKDLGKVAQMALVHDLPESRTGDVDYLSRQYVKRDEELGIHDMFEGTSFETEVVELWQEYEERKTLEAKIVKDADNLDIEFEIVDQEYRGHAIGTVLNKGRKELVYPKLFTKTAKEFWKEIHKTNPHSWHLNGRNRFSSGDWKKK